MFKKVQRNVENNQRLLSEHQMPNEIKASLDVRPLSRGLAGEKKTTLQIREEPIIGGKGNDELKETFKKKLNSVQNEKYQKVKDIKREVPKTENFDNLDLSDIEGKEILNATNIELEELLGQI